MKLTQKQLRRLIRESVKQRLVSEAIGVKPELTDTAEHRVEQSTDVHDLVMKLVSELLTLSGNDDESQDEMYGMQMAEILMRACIECVEILDAMESNEDDDVALPPPHPAGAHKGQW